MNNSPDFRDLCVTMRQELIDLVDYRGKTWLGCEIDRITQLINDVGAALAEPVQELTDKEET